MQIEEFLTLIKLAALAKDISFFTPSYSPLETLHSGFNLEGFKFQKSSPQFFLVKGKFQSSIYRKLKIVLSLF